MFCLGDSTCWPIWPFDCPSTDCFLKQFMCECFCFSFIFVEIKFDDWSIDWYTYCAGLNCDVISWLLKILLRSVLTMVGMGRLQEENRSIQNSRHSDERIVKAQGRIPYYMHTWNYKFACKLVSSKNPEMVKISQIFLLPKILCGTKFPEHWHLGIKNQVKLASI